MSLEGQGMEVMHVLCTTLSYSIKKVSLKKRVGGLACRNNYLLDQYLPIWKTVLSFLFCSLNTY